MRRLDDRTLRGSYPPLVTPFRDGRIDLDAFTALVDRQVREGSHGIVVCGTSGEASSLSARERLELVRAAVRASAGRLPVVAATGSASFEETSDLTRQAEAAGADAVLIVTPYYVRPSQDGLVEYFAATAGCTRLPVLLYHIPGRAAVSMTSETVGRIVERAPHVVGVKHAAPDLDLVSELLVRLGDGFRVFCGLESLSLPMLAVGAAGVMNAVGNLAPRAVAALCDDVAALELARARQRHFELFELSQAIFLETNPVPLKYMMARLGLIPTPEVRLPLVELRPERAKLLDDVLRRSGLTRAEAASVSARPEDR